MTLTSRLSTNIGKPSFSVNNFGVHGPSDGSRDLGLGRDLGFVSS